MIELSEHPVSGVEFDTMKFWKVSKVAKHDRLLSSISI